VDGESREVELKFTLDPARGPEILAWLGQGRRPSRLVLTSIYYDTADRALHGAGFALRVRDDNGGWIQAVKSRLATGGKFGRGEWEAAVTGPVPDLAVARRTPAKRALGAGVRLETVFTVRVERSAVEIRTPDSVIEACLDSGQVEACDRRARVDELELELKSGSPLALFTLAHRLQETWPVGLSVVTKADRGFALAHDGALGARHFQAPRLTARMTAGEAFRAMARAAVEQIVWNAELLRAAPTPEAIHQTRVGLRRLRATLRTFKRVAADGRALALTARLKWLGGELDPARDLDVFIEGAWDRAAAAHDRSGDDANLRAARTAAYARAQAAARDPRLGELVLGLLSWIEAGPWTFDDADGARPRDRSLVRFAMAALEKGRARLLEAGSDLSRLDTETRHRLRIRAKGLRYAADVFDQVFHEHPKRARRFLAALEGLLEALGDLNDIATARVLAPTFTPSPDVLALEAARERTLVERAEAAFKQFRAVKPYWRH